MASSRCVIAARCAVGDAQRRGYVELREADRQRGV
jgi:hypothetical protein